MQKFRIFLLSGLLVIILGASLKVYQCEALRRDANEDLIELSKVKYGLFNIDEWKVVVARVVTKKVQELELTDANRGEMRTKITDLLTQIITGLEDSYKKENRGSIKGYFKNAGASFLDVFGKMKRNIPEFTDQIMRFIDDPQNREALRKYILKQINTYADNTFAETDYTLRDAIVAKYGAESAADAKLAVKAHMANLEHQKVPFAWILFTALLLLFVALLLVKTIPPSQLAIAIAIAFLPLILGILLPMIEIDARIAEMRFQLIGEPVSFTDQVIFFKSKSIIEVVSLMIEQGKADLLAVGFLVLSFSVLFPFSKLISSFIFLIRPQRRKSKFLRFMIFKTGKWSMADVMVVAIFMSYIGFSGIISEQLNQLDNIAKNADVLTTNQSSLRIGFFLFTGFVMLSLAISQRMGAYKESDKL